MRKLGFVVWLVVFLGVGYRSANASGSITGPGDIAFTGYNADETGGFAFVLLGDASASQEIFFTDYGWDGTNFTGSEGVIKWTAPSGGLSAGTVIYISNTDSGTLGATLGIATEPDGGFNLSGDDDSILAYLGAEGVPTAFVGAISNDLFDNSSVLLTNTGLTVGTDAFELRDVNADADIAAYNGSRTNQSTAADYLAQIMDSANWVAQDASNDQSNDKIEPDIPFDTTSFTKPTAITLTEFSAGTVSQSTNGLYLVLLCLGGSAWIIGKREQTKNT
jgi:hypothetical protein